ncbi:unnamed protein product [Rotaria sp. Silwood1]|nr:unnamed protein product [Rotaria sp. Silwood1]
MNNNTALTMENLNPRVIDLEYGVRGPVAIQAAEIEEAIKSGKHDFPFDHIIRANLGDGFASGHQIPITYIRQFIAGCTHPALMNSSYFPSDVKQRVERLLSACAGKNLGSYSGGPGIMAVREDIANFIQRRDGYPSDPHNIFLCNGASDGLKTVIKLLMNNNPKKPSGIVSLGRRKNLE